MMMEKRHHTKSSVGICLSVHPLHHTQNTVFPSAFHKQAAGVWMHASHRVSFDSSQRGRGPGF